MGNNTGTQSTITTNNEYPTTTNVTNRSPPPREERPTPTNTEQRNKAATGHNRNHPNTNVTSTGRWQRWEYQPGVWWHTVACWAATQQQRNVSITPNVVAGQPGVCVTAKKCNGKRQNNRHNHVQNNKRLENVRSGCW